jgi:hypothetical protein
MQTPHTDAPKSLHAYIYRSINCLIIGYYSQYVWLHCVYKELTLFIIKGEKGKIQFFWCFFLYRNQEKRSS